jgi:hypothetical protein
MWRKTAHNVETVADHCAAGDRKLPFVGSQIIVRNRRFRRPVGRPLAGALLDAARSREAVQLADIVGEQNTSAVHGMARWPR